MEREIRELFKTWRLPEEGIPTFEESKEIKERTGTSPRYPARVGGSKGSSDVVGDGKWLHDKFDDMGLYAIASSHSQCRRKEDDCLAPCRDRRPTRRLPLQCALCLQGLVPLRSVAVAVAF